jgi:methanogen homocitrate synthase
LPELGELVRKASGIAWAANKPVLGERNFTRESGMGADLVMKEPLAMFGTHPALTGRTGEIVLGKKSGKASIVYNLEQMGIVGTSDEAIAAMLSHVKQKGIEKRGLLTPTEFGDIVVAVLGSASVSATTQRISSKRV